MRDIIYEIYIVFLFEALRQDQNGKSLNLKTLAYQIFFKLKINNFKKFKSIKYKRQMIWEVYFLKT